MTINDQYSPRYWDKKAFRYDKRAMNKKSPSYLSCFEHIRKAVEDRARVVDLGCGTGILSYALLDMVSSVVGVDISSGMLSMARGKQTKDKYNKTEFLKGDMHGTALQNNIADNVLLCNVLQFTRTPDILLLEAKRLARPNGLVITATTCYGTVRSIRGLFMSLGMFMARTFKTVPYTRFYTFKKLRSELENSGMVIIAEKKMKHMGKVGLFAVLKT
ncbi:MAG: class I SAM-dependent methyltransferase [Bacteroidales bacterium]